MPCSSRSGRGSSWSRSLCLSLSLGLVCLWLPRLRAVTPEVFAILKAAGSIDTPVLGEFYGRVDSDDIVDP